MLAHVAHVSWSLKHRIAHGVHGHEFMTSHHVHMTRHELMSNTPLDIILGARLQGQAADGGFRAS